MLKKNWVVMTITHRRSRHGNFFQEVLFANSSGEMAYTYLDKANDNYANWQRIVELYQLGAGVIVSGLKPKSGGKSPKQLVTADSPVRIQHVTETQDEVLGELVSVLEQENNIKG